MKWGRKFLRKLSAFETRLKMNKAMEGSCVAAKRKQLYDIIEVKTIS